LRSALRADRLCWTDRRSHHAERLEQPFRHQIRITDARCFRAHEPGEREAAIRVREGLAGREDPVRRLERPQKTAVRLFGLVAVLTRHVAQARRLREQLMRRHDGDRRVGALDHAANRFLQGELPRAGDLDDGRRREHLPH
jgi:hypothetical protein